MSFPGIILDRWAQTCENYKTRMSHKAKEYCNCRNKCKQSL